MTQNSDGAALVLQLAELKSTIKDIGSDVHRTAQQVDQLANQVKAMSGEVNKTKAIVEAWDAVKTGSKFIKWFAGVVAAVSAIIIATKTGISTIWGR